MSADHRDAIYLEIEAERLRQLRTEEIGTPHKEAAYLAELIEIHWIVERMLRREVGKSQ